MTDTRTYVTSLDQVKHFRAYLARFLDAAVSALSEAESRVEALVRWIKQDRMPYWKQRVARTGEQLTQARQELNRKRTFQESGMGARLSYVDEKKAIEHLQRQLDTAREKLAAVRHWTVRLEKEGLEFKGMVQELSSALQYDIPQMRAKIDAMVHHLEKYLALSPDDSPVQVAFDLEALQPEEEGITVQNEAALHDRCWLEQLRQVTPRSELQRDFPLFEPRRTGLEGFHLCEASVAIQANDHLSTPDTAEKTILIEEQLDICERVYLERVEDVPFGDSGWTVSSLSLQAPKRYYRMSLSQLQQRIPWIRNLMSLREGALIIVNRTQIEAIYDIENHLSAIGQQRSFG